METTPRQRPTWAIVFLLPLLGLAGSAAILDSGQSERNRELPRESVGTRRVRPTEQQEYAARDELRRILVHWRTRPSGTSPVELTPPLVRLCHRWPRTDAAHRAVMILCPGGGPDPVNTAWGAVNRPFRQEVPPEIDEIWGL